MAAVREGKGGNRQSKGNAAASLSLLWRLRCFRSTACELSDHVRVRHTATDPTPLLTWLSLSDNLGQILYLHIKNLTITLLQYFTFMINEVDR